MSDDPELDATSALVQATATALNRALAEAAERDLAIDLTISRQELQDDVNVRVGTAPHVDVTLRRHEGPDVDPDE